ncbi:MAG: hypothetical protein ACYDCN_10415 [Bacteroidia bacterium]
MKTNSIYLRNIVVKVEPFIFLCIVCSNLYPLFAGKYFPFMDAPAHLYNASLIKELLQGNTLISEYIKFNPIFVPNSISYLIITPLLYVFSPHVAEKMFIVCYFIGLPLAFRYCVCAINKQQKYLSLLVIPFTYNFLMMISFYNFCMGFVFMFLTIGFFYKHIINENTKWYHYLILFVLFMLTYCCHIVVFGLLLICLLFIYLWFLLTQFNFSVKKWFNLKTITLLIISLPVLYLTWVYFKAVHSINAQFVYLNSKELFDYFKSGRFLTIFNGDTEQIHSDFLALLYISTFLICIYSFLQNISASTHKTRQLYFLLPVLCSLGLYILLPDSDGLAGYVSIRICLLTFLVSIVVITSFNLSNKYLIPLCVSVIDIIQIKGL